MKYCGFRTVGRSRLDSILLRRTLCCLPDTLNIMSKSVRIVLLMAICLLSTACTTTKIITLDAAPRDLFDRKSPISVTGFHSISFRHGTVIGGKGKAAGAGALAGAGTSLAGGASTGDPLGLVLGVVLMPVFAVGGGIYGAVTAHSKEEVEDALTAIEKVYKDDVLLGALDDQVKKRVQSHMWFPENISCDESSNYADRKDQEAYESSFNAGCDLAAQENKLTITVTYSFSTEGSGALSPDLVIKVDVYALAADTDSTKEAMEYQWTYQAPVIDFFSATDSDASMLRSELASAQKQLADTIVQDLFIARRPTFVKVRGNRPLSSNNVKFMPVDATPTPGTVARVPTHRDLANIVLEAIEPIAETHSSSDNYLD